MHPVNLIAKSIKIDDPDRPIIDIDTKEGLCCLTGQVCQTVHRKEVIKPFFTDGCILASPSSERVGVDAYIALKYKWERKSSWICTEDEFKRLDRIGVREAVFGELPTKPWIGYATTSYKKHGSYRSVINRGDKRIWLFETRLVDCTDMDQVFDWWTRLCKIQKLGAGRKVLESLDCPPYLIKKIGPLWWIEFESWARKHYQSSLYAFLCYLLPSAEEIKQNGRSNKMEDKV